MIQYVEGDMDGQSLRIGIVVASFNDFITSKLLEGAELGLSHNNVSPSNIVVCRVPGSFEIPVVAAKMASSGEYDAIICLGSVIKGETDHYDLVAWEAARGIGDVGLTAGIPVIFGVLATHTVELARDRAGGRQGNAGYNCALTAVEMGTLMKKL